MRKLAQRGLAVATLLALVVAGCGAPTQEQAAGESPVDGFPLTIENCGRTLTFDRPPSRVLATYWTTAEIMVGLGLGDRVIGRFAPDAEPLPEQADVMNAIPVVSGNDQYNLAREELLALGPDLVLSVFYGFDQAQGQATIEDLRRIGAQAYEIDYCTDEQPNATVEDTYERILEVGRIFGVPDRAEQMVEESRARIAAVQDAIAGRPPVDVLVYQGGTSPIFVGARSIRTNIIAMSGGRQIFGDGEETGGFEANREEVAAVDAEVLFLEQYFGFGTAEEKAEFWFATFPNHRASQNRRTLTFDGIATQSSSWRSADIVEQMARALHPDAFQ